MRWKGDNMEYRIIHHKGQKSDLLMNGEMQINGKSWEEISQWLVLHLNPFDTVIEGYPGNADSKEENSISYTGFESLCTIRWANKIEKRKKHDRFRHTWPLMIRFLRFLNMLGTGMWWLKRSFLT